MLLTVDIGNTNISLGVFRNSRLIRRYQIPTKQVSYTAWLKRIFRQNNIQQSIICSVVPQVTVRLARALRGLGARNPHIIGKDTQVPISNLYRYPKQVGGDRLVNAYAGSRLYGSPLIVMDFGTAITFDVVSRDKAYLGGLILPGLQLSLDALNQRTALLPKIKLKPPREFIGRDTKNSLLSGVIYGYSSLADRLIEQIREKIGKGAMVIGTGGDVFLMGQYCRKINKIDKDLTLKGLNLIYKTSTRPGLISSLMTCKTGS